VEYFTQQADSIMVAWKTTLNKYNELRQKMTIVVPELGPSFGKEGQQMEEEATRVEVK